MRKSTITETKDFKDSLHCLNCAYEDLGYNGKMLCLPKTKSCQPVFPYDLMIGSRLRKLEIIKASSERNEDFPENQRE